MTLRRGVLRGLGLLLCGLAASLPVRVRSEETAAVFDGPAVACEEPLTAAPEARPGNVLRSIIVEERAGVARHAELVRVPLFFAAGECPALEELRIVPSSEGNSSAPLAWQADDIRRGPDGTIGRVHLWFAVDLAAGQRRRFQLVRVGPKSPPKDDSIRGVGRRGNELRFPTVAGDVTFSPAGELREIASEGRTWSFAPAGAFPHVSVRYPAHGAEPATTVELDRQSPGRIVQWAAGPLFSKLKIRVPGPDGLALEEEFRIPRNGREIVLSAALFVGQRPAGTVRRNDLLEGRLAQSAGAAKVIQVPAGARYLLRAEHAYHVDALTRSGAGLLAVPLVIGGPNGEWRVERGDAISLSGQRGLRQGGEGEKESLHAYWTEVRLVTTTHDEVSALWHDYREHLQPLVAIVEEPPANVDLLHDALTEIVREMKPVGWRQEAGRAYVLGDRNRAGEILEKEPLELEADPARLLESAAGARAKVTDHGARKLRDDQKGRAYGRLDPYHITYTQSAAAALVACLNAPARVSRTDYAMARALREVGGRIDDAGNPYIDCFGRALNMQMGPTLFGLTAAPPNGDAALAQFYRDLATSPPVLGIFGRGQRPYTGAPARSADQTDFLYQAICDFWLRATEILADENLQLHPLAFGRYMDCIDVMADVYHDASPHNKEHLPGLARANFFRGQAHTHRWLGWSCAPFIRLLADPAERSSVGLTEAIRYARLMKGRWKNWPDLTFYVLADLLVREALQRYTAPRPVSSPADVQAKKTSGGVELSWSAAPGAKSYRVYRAAAPGGPWTLLNSPYEGKAASPLTETHFRDPDFVGHPRYVVLATAEGGRASRWPERAASP